MSKPIMAKDKLQDNRNAAKVPLRDMRNPKSPALPAKVTWDLDLRGVKDDAGVVHTVLTIVNRNTGAVLKHTAIKNTKFFTLAWHVLLAIFRYGKPDAICTDAKTDAVMDGAIDKPKLNRIKK
jgi:hypothetical protein